MEAKEKAKELVNKYQMFPDGRIFSKETSKQCALICVDEIINSYDGLNENHGTEWNHDNLTIHFLEYWQEVKKEIETL